ncbi:hypothetical protein L218DRAFT_956290 [Marasmius fiardii PR-910]|nr:hypothetical protein L218DRAFT_956290 [Marasmius fiardii PR-910]
MRLCVQWLRRVSLIDPMQLLLLLFDPTSLLYYSLPHLEDASSAAYSDSVAVVEDREACDKTNEPDTAAGEDDKQRDCLPLKLDLLNPCIVITLCLALA